MVDIPADRDPGCASAYSVHGQSRVSRSCKTGYIEIDRQDPDPQDTLLHEFLHLLNRFDADSYDPFQAEEAATRRLTRLYARHPDIA